MQDSRLRDSPFHGVVSIGASNAESFGLGNPETTPLSIPTNPATPPRWQDKHRVSDVSDFETRRRRGWTRVSLQIQPDYSQSGQRGAGVMVVMVVIFHLRPPRCIFLPFLYH